MADEFVVFLVIGLAVLVILLAATNAFVITQQQPTQPVPLAESNDIRLVGIHGQEATRTESMDFAVGTDIAGQNIGEKKLFSGLLFGDNEFIFETTEDTDSVEISFKVVETNKLGDLIIKVDGKQIDKRAFNVGEYTFTVNGPIPSGTQIEIVPENSYWKIWAPTLYKLTDIRISTKSFARQVQEFRFNLIDDYDFFRQGRLEVKSSESYGNIRVMLNGNQIFHDHLKNINILQFGKDKLVKGENVIRIEADLESSAIGSTDLVIFYEEQVNKELVLPFTVTREEYDRMKGGFIRFEIVDITRSGGMVIKTRMGSETMLNEFTTAVPGPVTVFFGKADVRPGFNEVIIHGLEGATFKVKNIYVELR